jgi:hypothetical protein
MEKSLMRMERRKCRRRALWANLATVYGNAARRGELEAGGGYGWERETVPGLRLRSRMVPKAVLNENFLGLGFGCRKTKSGLLDRVRGWMGLGREVM